MSDILGVTFRILAGDRDEAMARARAIGVEQTIEFPEDLVTDPGIREGIIGRVLSLEPGEPGTWTARIGYSPAVAGRSLLQLLNVLFGNVSLQPGLRLEDVCLPEVLLARFRGPRYGTAGLRFLQQAPARPLLATAVKPMGLSPADLADLAYRFARGGMDFVKDDHGLEDQEFCGWEARVRACAAAVARANRETGGCTRYVANLTGPVENLRERARRARALGAGGLLVAPGLAGWDVLRGVAEDDGVGLPILMHPALLGSFTVSPAQGLSFRVLYGTLARLAGADAVVFPNHGGRFAFSPEDCREIVRGCEAPLGGLRTSLPAPAGGMSLARVPEMRAFYGDDVLLLIGGDLHRHGDLEGTCRRLRSMVELSPEVEP